MSEYVVEMRDIVKTFGEVQAVKNGEFTLKKGEIHSLIGENGAGKSTMMKLLYGMYPIDSGEIIVKGEKMTALDPKIAINHGIGMVHQEFMLVNELTVLENIILGFEPTKGFTIDFDKARKEVQQYIDEYDMEVQLDKKISQISVGEAQRVEIIKTLMRGADVIILDEPTAVLTPQEARRLFEILNNLREGGKSLVFISHKLNEVMEISDRISVMRQGNYMGTVEKKDTSPLDLTKRMIGREVFLDIDKSYEKAGDTILEVKDIWVPSGKETSKIRGMSLSVREGEIVGIAGIDGNGQSELIEAITGLRRVEKGSVIVNGKDVTNLSPRKVRQAGLAHIPEDRNRMGLNRSLSIVDNLVAVRLDEAPFTKGKILDKKAQDEYAEDMVKKLDIRCTGIRQPAGRLSGGNQQKVCLARALTLEPDILFVSEPTRGIDIGAKKLVLEYLVQLNRETGMTVVIVSSELVELRSISDRIAIIADGKLAGIFAPDAPDAQIGLAMSGTKTKGGERP